MVTEFSQYKLVVLACKALALISIWQHFDTYNLEIEVKEVKDGRRINVQMYVEEYLYKKLKAIDLLIEIANQILQFYNYTVSNNFLITE